MEIQSLHIRETYGNTVGNIVLTYLGEHMETRNYTYIVECSDGKFYTGWTNCIEKRIKAHNSGTGAKFTRCRTPVRLRYLEISETKSDAMKREAEIKKLKRCQKAKLIMQGQLEDVLAENDITI